MVNPLVRLAAINVQLLLRYYNLLILSGFDSLNYYLLSNFTLSICWIIFNIFRILRTFKMGSHIILFQIKSSFLGFIYNNYWFNLKFKLIGLVLEASNTGTSEFKLILIFTDKQGNLLLNSIRLWISNDNFQSF